MQNRFAHKPKNPFYRFRQIPLTNIFLFAIRKFQRRVDFLKSTIHFNFAKWWVSENSSYKGSLDIWIPACAEMTG